MVEDFITVPYLEKAVPISSIRILTFWTFVWIICISLPPGPKAINTAYRFNFIHGLISAVVAFLAMAGYASGSMAVLLSLAYFLVDVFNNLLNDFVFKVPTYQSPTARRTEYFHHFLCITTSIYSELYYKDVCDLPLNPIVHFVIAEASTPFLMAWRYYKSDIFAALFAISFFLVRIIYQCIYYVPGLLPSCNYHPYIVSFASLYVGINIFFAFQIIQKILFKPKKGDKMK